MYLDTKLINHARTLLLNKAASATQGEYIDPEFLPQTLPEWLTNIYRCIFDGVVDPEMRIRQIMQILHLTELRDYVLELDPRITYDPNSSNIHADIPSLLPVLAKLRQIVVGETEDKLFGQAAHPPYSTFKTLWHSNRAPYALGGILLAIIYRLNEQQGS